MRAEQIAYDALVAGGRASSKNKAAAGGRASRRAGNNGNNYRGSSRQAATRMEVATEQAAAAAQADSSRVPGFGRDLGCKPEPSNQKVSERQFHCCPHSTASVCCQFAGVTEEVGSEG